MNIESLLEQTGETNVRCSLSLVIPVYNEADVIKAEIREAVDSLRPQSLEFEILVVDDGSTPVVFLGRYGHSASFWVDRHEVVEFGTDQLEEFGAFVQQHERVVIVAAPGSMTKIRETEAEGLVIRAEVSSRRAICILFESPHRLSRRLTISARYADAPQRKVQ